MEELVSVIIPFYNRIPFVVESVKSVLNQTYQNYEIILIDDGSTEDTTEITDFIADQNCVKWIHQNNTGVAAARNAGIAAATGEYIAFLDSDDLFKPEKLERQLRLMKEAKVSISHTSYDQISLGGEVLNTVDFGKYGGKVFPEIISICPIATPTVMVKSEILKEIECPFNTAFHIGEDICLWIDLAFHYEILGIDESLTQVRIGDSSASQNRNKQRIGLLNIINHLFKNPEYLKYEKEIAYLIKTLQLQFEPTAHMQEQTSGMAKRLLRRIIRFLEIIEKEGFLAVFVRIKRRLCGRTD